MLSLLLAWLLPVKKKHLPCDAWDHSAAVRPVIEINKLKTPRSFRMWKMWKCCGLTFEYSASFFFVLFSWFYSPSSMGSRSPAALSHFPAPLCRITEAPGLSCAAVQSKIDMKPPKRRKGRDMASAWPWAWASEEQEATADPRPQGVCSGRLHQIEHGRLGVIWDPVIFIAFRSSCNWFDCREEKQNFVPKIVLVAFLLFLFSCTRGGFPAVILPLSLHSNGFIPSPFSSSLVALLHFLFPICCPFPLSHLFAAGAVGAGAVPRSWQSTSASLDPSAPGCLLPGSSDLPLPSSLCSNVSVQFYFFNWTLSVSMKEHQMWFLNLFVREAPSNSLRLLHIVSITEIVRESWA